jgi:uncharacterized repeat protein (TIGR03803 family)
MRNHFLAAIAVPALLLAAPAPSFADQVQALHGFCGDMGCRGGYDPIGIVQDGKGSLYGATYFGGRQADGTIFELYLDGSTWKRKTLHDFCAPPGCADSIFPTAAPIVDVNGNLYGTTLGSGFDDFGVIYELSPGADRKHWKYRVLYRFAGFGGAVMPLGGLGYAGQSSGLPYDGTSPLYGTTVLGGSNFSGTVYRLAPGTGTHKCRYDVLHEFCATDCIDGALPYAGVLVGPDDTLYGTTSAGGAANRGTVFALAPGKRREHWTATTLHDFCTEPKCADGSSPYAPVLRDAGGALFGTTLGGGSCSEGDGCGVLFKLSKESGSWRETVLHTFCAEENCADGTSPDGPLVMDSGGALYGTTGHGGLGDGILYAFDTSFRVVHTFCSSCAEGGQPQGPLLLSASSALLGSAATGGLKGGGAVYELKP